MQVKSSGQVLFDEVIKKLQVLEADYFDLQYTDLRNTQVRCIAILFLVEQLALNSQTECPFKGELRLLVNLGNYYKHLSITVLFKFLEKS